MDRKKTNSRMTLRFGELRKVGIIAQRHNSNIKRKYRDHTKPKVDS